MMHGQADRRAHFHTTITCAFPNGDVLQDDGEVEGTIAFAPMGENGFGYDPVFFVPDKRKTFAQLSAEEKAEISHRGKALRAFKETLKNYLADVRHSFSSLLCATAIRIRAGFIINMSTK